MGAQPLGNMDGIASKVILQVKKVLPPLSEGFVSTCMLRNFPDTTDEKTQPYSFLSVMNRKFVM